MKSNYIKNIKASNFAILLLVLPCMFACSFGQNDKKKTFVSCKVDNSKIRVDVDTFKVYKYYINVGSVIVDSGMVEEHKEFLIPNIVKGTSQNRKEIALEAAKNDYTHEIRIRINEGFDKTFSYRQQITEIPDDKISFTGFGAPLVKKSRKTSFDNELRVWLYRRNEHLDEKLFNTFSQIYTELSLTGDNEYVPVGNIPIVHDIDGYKFKIKSDIQADYYAVVACQNQAYINQFVERAVGNNFASLSTSLSAPLPCHYRKGTSGYRNIFLLCINKDWSYKQIPIATFALDNSAPEHILYNPSGYSGFILHEAPSSHEPGALVYNNRIKVLYPSNRPRVYGRASVAVINWNGNGLECNVTFRVEFSGDAKSVTIQRRGDLCYREYGGTYYFRQEDKVIYAKEHKGPYTFTYKMHFDDGDNIIPVIVEDYNGNKHKGSITIRAKFVRSNAPSINIDNNIDIYNN